MFADINTQIVRLDLKINFVAIVILKCRLDLGRVGPAVLGPVAHVFTIALFLRATFFLEKHPQYVGLLQVNIGQYYMKILV